MTGSQKLIAETSRFLFVLISRCISNIAAWKKKQEKKKKNNNNKDDDDDDDDDDDVDDDAKPR